jgi:hypothetical protein
VVSSLENDRRVAPSAARLPDRHCSAQRVLLVFDLIEEDDMWLVCRAQRKQRLGRAAVYFHPLDLEVA